LSRDFSVYWFSKSRLRIVRLRCIVGLELVIVNTSVYQFMYILAEILFGGNLPWIGVFDQA
jgi:hypothetical protein